MFSISKSVLFLIGIIRSSATAQPQIYGAILGLKDPVKLPWQIDIDKQCHEEALEADNPGDLFSMGFDGVGLGPFKLDELLTDEEKNNPSLLKLLKQSIYINHPQKTPDQPSAELNASAKEELKLLCDEYPNNMSPFAKQQLNELGCVTRRSIQRGLNFSNLIDVKKYPNIVTFIESMQWASGICFQNSNYFDNSPGRENEPSFHIDNSRVVSLNTHEAASTWILANAPFTSIDFVKFGFEKRMWRALLDGKFPNSDMHKNLELLRQNSYLAEDSKFFEAQIDKMISVIADQIGKEIDERAIHTRHFKQTHKNSKPPHVTYLPSGGVYKLSNAVHSSPGEIPDNRDKKACRLFMYGV